MVLFEDVQLGSHRFADLVRGVQGVGFRRTRINLLQDVSGRCRGAFCDVLPFVTREAPSMGALWVVPCSLPRWPAVQLKGIDLRSKHRFERRI